MTPKEKAKQLFEKYYLELKQDAGFYDFETARICALIAVDEVINSKPTNLNDKHNDIVDYFGNNQTIIYWRKVKQEIEKL